MNDMKRPRRAGSATEARGVFSSRNDLKPKMPSPAAQAKSRRESLPMCIATCRVEAVEHSGRFRMTLIPSPRVKQAEPGKSRGARRRQRARLAMDNTNSLPIGGGQPHQIGAQIEELQ
jgi:hypothetical protein